MGVGLTVEKSSVTTTETDHFCVGDAAIETLTRLVGVATCTRRVASSQGTLTLPRSPETLTVLPPWQATRTVYFSRSTSNAGVLPGPTPLMGGMRTRSAAFVVSGGSRSGAALSAGWGKLDGLGATGTADAGKASG